MSVRVLPSHVVGVTSWIWWKGLQINKVFHDLAKKLEFYGNYYHDLIDFWDIKEKKIRMPHWTFSKFLMRNRQLILCGLTFLQEQYIFTFLQEQYLSMPRLFNYLLFDLAKLSLIIIFFSNTFILLINVLLEEWQIISLKSWVIMYTLIARLPPNLAGIAIFPPKSGWILK